MLIEHMLMTGTVLKRKNKIITVPLLLKLIVRERRRKEGKEEETRKRKRERFHWQRQIYSQGSRSIT